MKKKAKRKKKPTRCLVCRLVITKAKVSKSNPWICEPCMNFEGAI